MKDLMAFGVGGVLVLILLTGCEPPKPPAAAPAPPKVTVAVPAVRDVQEWDEFTGRLEAVDLVQVKARVSGFLDAVTFKEGALVHQGDVLFTIDPRLFQASLDNAKAQVLQEEAKLSLAKSDLARGESVAKSGVITPEELDTRRATVEQAQGSLAAAKAAVEAAALNVEWCKVTAPITGRISNKYVTMGNMINGGAGSDTTVLTTITSMDPIYCYFDVDEATVLKYQKLIREKKRESAEQEPIPCYMGLDNETGFPHKGVVDFVDNRVNPATSTRRARARFENPNGTLLPGFFARLRLEGEELPNALLVMDDAIGTDQDKKYVFVVHSDNTVERRTVQVGPLEGEWRVIESGIKPDDKVLINGIATLIALPPGGKVDATEVTMPEHRLNGAVASDGAAPLPSSNGRPAGTQAASQPVAEAGR